MSRLRAYGQDNSMVIPSESAKSCGQDVSVLILSKYAYSLRAGHVLVKIIIWTLQRRG